MATVQTLARDAQYVIYRAFRLLKKIRAGDTLEADEETQALELLQDMMRGWETGATPLFKKEAARLTLVAGQGKYEIGDTVANGGFFARDLGKRVAQDPLVLEADVRNHGRERRPTRW